MTDTAGFRTRTTLYIGSSPAAVSVDGESRYLGCDESGSVRLLTGSYGSQTAALSYDVFGTPLTDAEYGNEDIMLDTVISRAAYAGKPYDKNTGLYDYGFRDYSPALARFTTLDPIQDGTNWYAYCNSDPVNFVDKWGLLTSEPKNSSDIISNNDTLLATSDITKVPHFWGNNITFAEQMQEQVGLKYVWGGDDPETDGGLDCSGSVLYGLRGIHSINKDVPDMTAADIYDWTISAVKAGPGIMNFTRDEENNIEHIQVIINENGDRVNATGNEKNTKDNPGIIKIIKGPVPDSGELRQFVWMSYEEEVRTLNGEKLNNKFGF